ncbi:Methyltransferase domain-containing protein [Roseomonas rosea]|uniref:Methyltransferase domain-containing protein n=1 Tax=Muricoccus roseus TaxID=198092 RepID=A0A1M6B5T6_9PROT|nr:class I SAM-dependent methyltransferase [Roseomonas rosea]SHI44017.1 Methyltransferase domain-containing protein [Roseomonas rosea]
MSEETAGYRGLCNLCGAKGFFPAGGRSTRESFPCPSCRAALRWREQAAIILDEFARGQSVFLRHLVGSGKLNTVDIFEVALRGPFVTQMKGLPRYVRSYFWPDRPLGSVDEEGVRCEDLTQLTFPDESFDLVLSSDVMEHVHDIHTAFAEIARVLKPGGVHIFSIPNDWPFPDRSEPRVELIDGEEHHLKPPRYHVSGDGSPCIVTWDYGADIVDILAATGCSTQVVRRHSGIDPCYVNATFVARKRG